MTTANAGTWLTEAGVDELEQNHRDMLNAVEILDGSTGTWYFNIEPGSVTIDYPRRTVTFTVRWNRTGARRRITLGWEQVRGIRVDLPG